MPRDGTTSFPFVDPKTLKRAAVVCHRNADADSYLSAYAVCDLLGAVSPDCETVIAVPEGMTTLTMKLSRKFPHRTVEQAEGDYDLIVAVDVGDTELLKDWKMKMAASRAERVLIDHHPLRDSSVYDDTVVDDSATSAAEVVFRLFEGLQVKPGPDAAQALLEGILFDSSHLAIAGEKGLRSVVKLLDAGADLAEARRTLRSDPDYGEVLAKLKGAQRIEIFKAGKWVVCTSRVGSFQAHVARALVFLGSDVAIVVGETEGETRVSLRSTQRFYDTTRLHVGTQVAEVLGNRLGGHGGGHATAASFSCDVEEEEAAAKTLDEVGHLLGETPTEVK